MIDLHTHSNYSDGTSSPAELVTLAERQGLGAIALTDHDTVRGIPEFLAAAEGSSVEAVPGIELSAECASGTMHVLGYFIDHTCVDMLARIEKVRKSREERNLNILKKLNKLGYVLRWCDVERQAGCDVVGRPHFAAALMERGLVKSRREAFDLLLAKGRPAYAERYRYEPSECIELIRAAGGVAVLAHPATVGLPDAMLFELVRSLKAVGLGGIETYYAENQTENIRKFMAWGEELGLVCTGGTDFHGENSPDIHVGIGFGHLAVPDEALARLREVARQ